VSFQNRLREASRANKSKIVLALDLEDADRDNLVRRSCEMLMEVGKSICAVKINRQLVLSLGLRDGVDSVVKLTHELSLPAIMDAKLNDVGHTNEFMTRSYFDIGFDGIIASPISGWEGGLDSAFQLARSLGKGVILLVHMSNPGAETLYSLNTAPAVGKPRPVFEIFAEMAVQWKASGVVVGATKPDIISRVRKLVGPDIDIFSPGVGVQGGDAGKAIAAGADYLIVGRSIYAAADPAEAASRYCELST
jgi:orotidine-5'-phosphate decarboxylase